MTNQIPEHPCEKCGGPLVPPELAPPRYAYDASDPPDYVCVACRLRYYWVGNPPALVMALAMADAPADEDAAS